LAVANWLNVLIRQSKHIGMATIAQSVNVIAPLMTTPTGLMKQTTWWPLLLFSKYMRGSTVACHVSCGEYEGPTEPEWIRGTIETPWLETSATVSDDGVVSMVVVNIHESKSFTVRLEGISSGTEVEVHTVTGDSLQSTNTEEKTEVGIKESVWTAQETYDFPRASMTMLRWNPAK
jgi:alpha-N-arabinofuranosidase